MVRRARNPRKSFIVFMTILGLSFVGAITFIIISSLPSSQGPTAPTSPQDNSMQAPQLRAEVVAEGLNHVWEIAFLPEGGMLLSERGGRLLYKNGNDQRQISGINDVYVQGEAGLMGLEIDREFADNRYIYTCYASQSNDVRVVRWVLSDDESSLSSPTAIVRGIPLNDSGRHSGCRIKMDTANVLWVGTGDAAIGTHPQNPDSLAGKILRVNRDGTAASGNLSEPFDERIYSYGHRNTQGIALYEDPGAAGTVAGIQGFSVEHGPNTDDEVNPLVAGNFGWNPVPFYNEQVPMTDTDAFADAVESFWSSGSPTIAPSGATMLRGEQWGVYENGLAVATLKGLHLRIQTYDVDGKLTRDDVFFEGDFGRLRAASLGPDNNLYLSTSNGADKDRVIRITAQ